MARFRRKAKRRLPCGRPPLLSDYAKIWESGPGPHLRPPQIFRRAVGARPAVPGYLRLVFNAGASLVRPAVSGCPDSACHQFPDRPRFPLPDPAVTAPFGPLLLEDCSSVDLDRTPAEARRKGSEEIFRVEMLGEMWKLWK